VLPQSNMAKLTDDQLPFAFADALQEYEADLVRRFENRCREIGTSLLASRGKSEEKQCERALGYGNRAMLLASRFNVPTQTLTCFWMDGTYDGVEWHADTPPAKEIGEMLASSRPTKSRRKASEKNAYHYQSPFDRKPRDCGPICFGLHATSGRGRFAPESRRRGRRPRRPGWATGLNRSRGSALRLAARPTS
jgi:hypothetical protein